MHRSRNLTNFAFHVAALGMICAAAYHGLALLLPSFAQAVYSSGYPVQRHVLFITIDVGFAGLLFWRPIWLIWLYAVLAMQQLKSHGSQAWNSWHTNGRVAVADIVVVIGIMLIFGLLFVDWYKRRQVDDL